MGDPLDLCACGDYRQQHLDGVGRCLLGELCTPYGCRKFRLSRAALTPPPRIGVDTAPETSHGSLRMSIYLAAAAESAAVKALGEDIGFGRIIQLAHQHWDAMLEANHGIKGHGEAWTLASADLIRERRAQDEAGRTHLKDGGEHG